MKKQECIMCGLCYKDGIIIEGKKICSRCEKRILEGNMYTDFYEHYTERIKKYIVPVMIKGVNRTCRSYH